MERSNLDIRLVAPGDGRRHYISALPFLHMQGSKLMCVSQCARSRCGFLKGSQTDRLVVV